MEAATGVWSGPWSCWGRGGVKAWWIHGPAHRVDVWVSCLLGLSAGRRPQGEGAPRQGPACRPPHPFPVLTPGSEGRGLSKLLALGLGTCPLLLPGLDQTQLRACRGQQGPRGLHTREGDPGDNPPLGAARQGPIDCVLWLGDRRLGQEGPQHSSPGLRLAEPPPPRPAPPPHSRHLHVLCISMSTSVGLAGFSVFT